MGIEVTQKTWGVKYNIFQNDLCEVSILELEPNRRCSFHMHKEKYNLFFVIEGELGVESEWPVDGAKMEHGLHRVGKHHFVTVRPRIPHNFVTFDKPTKIIEIMYVVYDPEDIKRASIGGPTRKPEKKK